MAARRKKKLPRLSSPGPQRAAWQATMRDLARRIGETWETLLRGWDDRIARDPKHVFAPGRKDATRESIDQMLARVRIETEQTIDASGIDDAADEIGDQTVTYCSSELKRVFGIPTSRLLPSSIVDGFRKENVSLIRGMAEEELDTIGGLLRDADAKGTRYDVLSGQLQERLGIAERRADLIARDQIGKLNAAISQRRQTDAGIEEYDWNTTGDDRVRDTHEELHDTRHRWDDPPVVNEETGETAHPGEDYSCRCVAIPVIPWLDDPLEDEEPEAEPAISPEPETVPVPEENPGPSKSNAELAAESTDAEDLVYKLADNPESWKTWEEIEANPGTTYWRVHAAGEPVDTVLNPKRPDGWTAGDETVERQPFGVSAATSRKDLVKYIGTYGMNLQPGDRLVAMSGKEGGTATDIAETRVVVKKVLGELPLSELIQEGTDDGYQMFGLRQGIEKAMGLPPGSLDPDR